MSVRFPAGNRLREARRSAGLSVEAVAIAAGRTAFSIHSYELGRVEPPLHVLATIAEQLGVTVSEILGEQVSA